MTWYPRNFLEALTTAIRDRQKRSRPTLVAIDGPGCGGKTSLVEELCQVHGGRASVLGLDDFLVPLSEQTLVRSADEDLSTTVPHLRWSEVETLVLDSLAIGRDGPYRPYQWDKDTIGPEVSVTAAPLILVEGLYALHPRLRDAYDFKIWVDGRRDNRMSRARARMIEAGLSEEDRGRWIGLWHNLYVPREQAYIAAARPHEIADLFVMGADLQGTVTRGAFAYSFSI